MKIVIETIPHDKQRYETVGDWWVEKDTNVLQIRVSEMGDDRYHFLVALHELVEATLCNDRGISVLEVDEFDKAFEAKRPAGNTDEPGDDPDAPYHLEHGFATGIERLLASALGLNWTDYDDAVMAL